MKECYSKELQGHGVVLHDQGEGYQQPITFRCGSRQVSMSVEEVSLHFLGGDPIPYIGLVPIDPRSSLIKLVSEYTGWQSISEIKYDSTVTSFYVLGTL